MKHATDTPQTVLKRYAYAYDPAGNRTVEQIDDAVTLSAYDNLNRLTSQAPGGPMVVAGSLNEPGTVTISGVPAVVDANNDFRGTVATTSGTNTFTIVAKDGTGNTTTKTYEVALSGSSKTFTYDANGNVTELGAKLLTWDARDRLVSIAETSNETILAYDGWGRWRRFISLEGSTEVDRQSYVWDISEPLERRDGSTGGTIGQRVFRHGSENDSIAMLLFRNHLTSVSATTAADTGSIAARFEYEPFGFVTATGSPGTFPIGYTGMIYRSDLELNLMEKRLYAPSLGRWISEDPIRLDGGPNLYSYVINNPLKWVDPKGTNAESHTRPHYPVDGNVLPGHTKQDWICSSPMGPLNNFPCVEKCCVVHDACYRAFRCNWTSWLTTAATVCAMCNWNAVGCIIMADKRRRRIDDCNKCGS